MAVDTIARGMAGYGINVGTTALDIAEKLQTIGRFLSTWNCVTGKPKTDPTTLPYTYKSGDYYIVDNVATDGYIHTITLEGTTSNEGTYQGTYSVTFSFKNQTATAYTTISAIATALGDTSQYTTSGTLNITGGSSVTIDHVLQWTDSSSNKVIALVHDTEKYALTGTTATTLIDSVSGGLGTTNYKPNGSTYTGTASTTVESSTVVLLDMYYYDGTNWVLLSVGPKLSQYYVKPDTGIPASDLATAVQNSLTLANSAYQKPATGISKTDFAESVQDSLDNADYAYTFTEAWKRKVCGYGGIDLSTKFTVAELHAKVADEDFTGIDIGDYWPITLSGTFVDQGAYTVPAGTTWYSDAECTTEGGTYSAATEGYWQSDTVVIIDSTHYVLLSDCSLGVTRTLSNAVMKMEVAGFNVYKNTGDTVIPAHILFFSRDGLPVILRMRLANTKWSDETTFNPWCGSALYQTLNDADDGVVALVEDTDLGAYLYAGPNNKGMRITSDLWNSARTAVSTIGTIDRGKLFLPCENEICNTSVWVSASQSKTSGVSQWPIFKGSSCHVVKHLGNSGSKYNWWSSNASNYLSFSGMAANGFMSPISSFLRNAVPLGFLFV